MRCSDNSIFASIVVFLAHSNKYIELCDFAWGLPVMVHLGYFYKIYYKYWTMYCIYFMSI